MWLNKGHWKKTEQWKPQGSVFCSPLFPTVAEFRPKVVGLFGVSEGWLLATEYFKRSNSLS